MCLSFVQQIDVYISIALSHFIFLHFFSFHAQTNTQIKHTETKNAKMKRKINNDYLTNVNVRVFFFLVLFYILRLHYDI